MTGIPRIVLLLTAACALSGCVQWNRHHYFYATDFDLREGVYVVAWPVDGSGEQWRYLVEKPREGCDATPVRLWGEGASPIADDEPTAGVVVVLPDPPDPLLRDRALRLADGVVRSHPGAGVHVVTDDVAWSGFTSAGDVAHRLATRRTAAIGRRPFPGTWSEGLMLALLGSVLGVTTPRAVVVPRAGVPGQYLVATNVPGSALFRREGGTADDIVIEERDPAGLLALARESPASDRYLPFDTILLVKPAGMDPRCRDAYDAVIREASVVPGLTVVQYSSAFPAESLAKTEDLRSALDATPYGVGRSSLLRPPTRVGD